MRVTFQCTGSWLDAYVRVLARSAVGPVELRVGFRHPALLRAGTQAVGRPIHDESGFPTTGPSLVRPGTGKGSSHM